MDHATFDRAARMLAAAASRRAGIAAAIGAAIGVRIGTDIGAGDAAARPAPASPCGKRRNSVCSSDSDCCRGRCKTGLANNDGMGRCRCVRRNGACTADQDCCDRQQPQGIPRPTPLLSCNDGVCGCVESGQACNPGASCCFGNAMCMAAPAFLSGRGAVQNRCCTVPMGVCERDADCCGEAGLICGQGACCSVAGAECGVRNRQCCAGMTCSGGVCVTPDN